MKGLVLSGGKSSRMGSPKAAINYHGEPEYVRCAKLLKLVCSDVYVSTSQNWKPETREVAELADLPGASIGPLSGILAAFNHDAQATWIVLACDLPFWNEHALLALCEQRDPLLQATCFLGHQGRPEPLCAIYEPSATDAIIEAVAQDRRCARALLESLKFKSVVPANANWVRNINSRDERTLFSLNPPLLAGEGDCPPSPDLAEAKSPSPASQERVSKQFEIHVEFVAQLRECAGISKEKILTHKTTPREIYQDLSLKYGFLLSPDHMRVAINDDMADWDTLVCESDRLMFLPPVAGG